MNEPGKKGAEAKGRSDQAKFTGLGRRNATGAPTHKSRTAVRKKLFGRSVEKFRFKNCRVQVVNLNPLSDRFLTTCSSQGQALKNGEINFKLRHNIGAGSIFIERSLDRQMKKKILLAFILILLPVAVLSAREVLVPMGFWKGTDWRNNEPQRLGYAMGVVDGMLLASARGNEVSLDWLKQCVDGKNSNQLLTVLQNEVDRHPELLNDGMHIIAYRALLKACPNAPKFAPTK